MRAGVMVRAWVRVRVRVRVRARVRVRERLFGEVACACSLSNVVPMSSARPPHSDAPAWVEGSAEG